jgi:hypothetical protein
MVVRCLLQKACGKLSRPAAAIRHLSAFSSSRRRPGPTLAIDTGFRRHDEEAGRIRRAPLVFFDSETMPRQFGEFAVAVVAAPGGS